MEAATAPADWVDKDQEAGRAVAAMAMVKAAQAREEETEAAAAVVAEKGLPAPVDEVC